MCGIFGLIYKEKNNSLKNVNTQEILRHRGPDDMGWLLYDGRKVVTGKNKLPDAAANILLLHRRLSILDLSAAGWQPMSCIQNRYYLIFNGEIYNYLELRELLIKEGISFVSNTDSEVLLKAYIRWGKECLSKLIGMFAFVILDIEEQKIFVARDHFGIKPFYYFVDHNQFLFSSEIKSLLSYLPHKKLNPERAFWYLRSGVTDFGDETLLSGVKQVPAGHFLELSLDDFSLNGPICYWKINNEINNEISFVEAAQTVRDLFLNNIKLHLRSDVAVAATLSGGIDSSSIVMAVRYLHPNIDVHTLSYIADDAKLSEESWINIVNNRAGAINHKVFASAESLVTDLEQLIAIQDEPFGSTSIYAQHQIFKRAQTLGMKVMLDGQGADEMLGGYTFFVAARFVSLIKQFKFKAAWQLLRQTQQLSGTTLLVRSLNYLLPPAWQLPLRRITGTDYIPSWLNINWFKGNEVRQTPIKKAYGQRVLKEELLYTFSHSSLPMLLRYQDRNSMAYSIESRVPFLTKDLVEFIFSLPENFLVAEDGLSKAVFRQAMTDIVPDEILDRRDKIGFATPEKNWLSTLAPWIEKILMSPHAKQLPLFRHQRLMEDWQGMLRGNSRFDFRFWRWINFIKWTEINQVEVQ